VKFWISISAFVAVLLCVHASCFAQGGPPMIGDDPGTPGNGKWEIDVASPFVQTDQSVSFNIPYIDANYGLGDHDTVEVLVESRLVCDYAFRSNDLILDVGTRIALAEHVQLLLAGGRGVRNGADSPHLYLYAGVGFIF
jgi:hypothetical protein